MGGARLPPGMRKGLLVTGIVILVLGAAIAGYGFTANSQSITVAPGSAVQPSTNTVGSDPVTIGWSGGSSSTTVTLYNGCSSSSSVIDSGTGASGSFTATLTAGGTYCIAAGSSTVTVTVTNHGISYLDTIGIIILVVGLVIALVGAVTKPRVRAAPVAPTASEVSAAATAAGTDVYTSGPEAAAPAAGNRPNLVCTYCGTSNEAWLTNCRQCKRPLSSTAQ